MRFDIETIPSLPQPIREAFAPSNNTYNTNSTLRRDLQLVDDDDDDDYNTSIANSCRSPSYSPLTTI